MSTDHSSIVLLAIALSLGLLVGVERGFKYREQKEGSRIAGLRTYSLISLLGAVAVMMSQQLGNYFVGIAFAALAIALIASYSINSTRENASLTSLIAALLTFSYGALVMMGYVTEAASLAVVTTLVLSMKGELHRWLHFIDKKELWAALELLLISVVILSIIPNEDMGPWDALNPYEIWWMVVLISSISFVGYFAMRIAGARKGIMLTALFAGFASSTALTLQFSRMAKQVPAASPLLAAGILFACGTMYPRVLLVASVINPELMVPLAIPTLTMALVTYIPALWLWFKGNQSVPENIAPPASPLSLWSALGFGVLLSAILLLSSALQATLGDTGILILAAASGVADVDPINLSLSGMSREGLALDTAVLGIVIAASVNGVLKAGMIGAIGGREMFNRGSVSLLAASIIGLLIASLL
ncbi:MgtC/SapB family protein [Maribrevibacterium harenarium]|uniref:MgtC/SapB family protein n=1 Tax=Maribrevibacterium harenarium TaxID=2589817 RepID=A0A501WHM5_9GAMM|nr:MgtC/SapB family protein [Maribrevibacterium harenarium]TPE47935.1 MgtC/SapB family protein [Maribrevibacterium harenarium]